MRFAKLSRNSGGGHDFKVALSQSRLGSGLGVVKRWGGSNWITLDDRMANPNPVAGGEDKDKEASHRTHAEGEGDLDAPFHMPFRKETILGL